MTIILLESVNDSDAKADLDLERNACTKQLVSSRFPLSRNFGIPLCCRVTLQPGLGGHSSISFLRLQDAQTIVYKPDCNEKPTAQRGLVMESGYEAAKNHKPFIF